MSGYPMNAQNEWADHVLSDVCAVQVKVPLGLCETDRYLLEWYITAVDTSDRFMKRLNNMSDICHEYLARLLRHKGKVINSAEKANCLLDSKHGTFALGPWIQDGEGEQRGELLILDMEVSTAGQVITTFKNCFLPVLPGSKTAEEEAGGPGCHQYGHDQRPTRQAPVRLTEGDRKGGGSSHQGKQD